MKANAPEKIYISPAGVLYKGDKQQNDDIEYVRKDAFIEKACEFLDGCIPDYIDLKHANVDNKRFIDEFREYMEGE